MSENKDLGVSGSSVEGNISQKVQVGIVSTNSEIFYFEADIPYNESFNSFCLRINRDGLFSKHDLWHSPNSIKNIELIGSN